MSESSVKPIVILGIFVADATFQTSRQPRSGETLKGNSFSLGPGGKGSNQSVAVARLGSEVTLISKLGNDAFGQMAFQLWQKEGVAPEVEFDPKLATGAACILVNEGSGENSIIVVPGAANGITPEYCRRKKHIISEASVFMTQFETPIDASIAALEIARSARVTTILNPAPAAAIEDQVLELCDFLIPNETEAAALTGLPVETIEEAEVAASELHRRGASTVILTLGESGALYFDGNDAVHIRAASSGPVVETTGAGDSFCGAFAHALGQSASALNAAKFANAAASLSVTRAGTAPSMPTAREMSDVFIA